mmetsp:Transcript_9519/g.23704  ORF Transcript_9519/g.23704 Transcript_9519/m.23704 type:complete len:186 (-) Transcript_9519:2407-2964(-)
MKCHQVYKGTIWYAVFWISTGSLLCISSVFLQDSRITKPLQGNPCERKSFGKNISKSPLHLLLPKHEENEPTSESVERDKANCFGSISTRIYMVGPISKEEECGLVGESVMSSPGSAIGMPSLAHGILCPETVNKMEMATQGGRSNRAVKAFLDRYHKYGPMSCMELLSDPEILHHLTTTMRDLA